MKLALDSDANPPRGRDTIGRSLDALGALLAANEANDADDAFTDRVQRLGDAVTKSRPPRRRSREP